MTPEPLNPPPGRPILVIGDLMTDVVARVEDPMAIGSDTPAQVVTRQGGAGGNVSHWLMTLGCPTIVVGRVGDDPFGREAARVLELAGVEVHLGVDPHLATGTCVVLVGADGERTMLPDAGANSALTVGDLPDELVQRAGHVHLSGYTLLNPGSRAAGLSAVRRALEARTVVSVDLASTAPLEAVGAKEFLRMTEGITLAICTLDEAEVLCGSRDPAVVGARLTAAFPQVVLKLGADGAQWCSADDLTGVRVPAATAPGPVVDTTGAGDGFAAALLATLSEHAGGAAQSLTGAVIRAALGRACEVAADIVTRPGSRPPT